MTIVHIWWAQNRRVASLFAIVAVVGAVVGIVSSYSASCSASMTHAQCVQLLNQRPLAPSLGLVAIFPVFVGLVFGVEAIGRERQDRTTTFAWSIAGNRRRWLLERVAPGVTATVLIALVCGAANIVVVARLNPGHDIASSFVDYGLWGPLVVARALAAYAVGLLVGLLIGRLVAAMALAIVLGVLALPTALYAGRAFEPTVILSGDDSGQSDGLGMELGWLAPSGEFMPLPLTSCQVLAPAGLTSEQQDIWVSENCPFASTFILGSRMPIVEVREASVLLLISFACVTAAFLLVANRRP